MQKLKHRVPRYARPVEALEPRRLMAAADLDPTFGSGGVVKQSFGASFGAVHATAAQRDGKLLVAGQTSGASNVNATPKLVRYLADGSADSSFTATSELSRLGRIVMVRQLAGAKILLAGSTYTVARLNADGSADTSFGGTAHGSPAGTPAGFAKMTFDGQHEALDADLAPDGRIALVGFASDTSDPDEHARVNAIAVFKADGSPDTGFSTDGKLQTPRPPQSSTTTQQWDQVALAPDGKIVVALHGDTYSANDPDLRQNFVRFLRFHADGGADATFGSAGEASAFVHATLGGQFTDIDVASDGSVIGVGHFGQRLAIAKVTPAGALDTTFDNDGQIVTTFNRKLTSAFGSLHLLGDGRFYAAATENHGDIVPDAQLLLARYNANGTLDTTFGGNEGGGGVARFGQNGAWYLNTAVTVAPDGKPVLATAGRDNGVDPTYWSTRRLQGDPPVRLNARGTLLIDGTADGDTVSVGLRARDGRLIVRVNEHVRSFAPSKVKRFAAFTFGGNDGFTIGAGAKGGYCDGGDGDDTLNGGSGADVFLGGAGRDHLFGNDGDDVLVGGDGNDYCLGGAGKDDLFGNGGVDTLSGAGGNDRLFGGPDSSDIVKGGAGADSAARDDEDSFDAVENILEATA
ncbi:MAG TPA: hypothetical protein VER17_10055 [Tepidisphaeraceae bacterium]|nr:hypothetical protein [Tepidisphaeraceae bacterium]